ncbi:uncharacterized protein LAJ45_05644 [Morchella importuna]|uniref:uncharacterized protein n=1 Tax=Morchella importuna TaxID=1174673 RepID=UPI001E8E38DF|nr:uncharacterized protein LAJ45_05644 [Morchella importuna]KAH8150432.1 hypothetical protein LAJ45_05644 [Morchella importuna]
MPPKESKDGRPSRSSRPSTRRSTPVNTPSSSKPSAPHTQPASAPHKATSASASASGSVKHGSESDWSEPPLATPKASYKEYDDKALMNTSTTHMLPLGELPTPKMLEATKRPYPGGGKKKGKQPPQGNGASGWTQGGTGGNGAPVSKIANGGPIISSGIRAGVSGVGGGGIITTGVPPGGVAQAGGGGGGGGGGAPAGVAQGGVIPGGVVPVGVAPAGVPTGVPAGVPAGVPGGVVPTGIPGGGVPVGVPGGVVHGVVHGVPGGVPESVPGGMIPGVAPIVAPGASLGVTSSFSPGGAAPGGAALGGAVPVGAATVGAIHGGNIAGGVPAGGVSIGGGAAGGAASGTVVAAGGHGGGGVPPPLPVTPMAGSSRSAQTQTVSTQTVKVKPPVITTPAPVSAPSPGGMTIGSSGSPPANPSTPSGSNGSRPGAVNGAWLNGNAPNSKTPQGRQRLSMVVDAAIERSAQVGNVDLGRAIKKLYDESLSNSLLADLLDAVLAQKATSEQIHQFQTYVRNARDPNATSAEPTSAANGTQPPDGAPPPTPMDISQSQPESQPQQQQQQQQQPQPQPQLQQQQQLQPQQEQTQAQNTAATNGIVSTGGNSIVKKEKMSRKERKKNGIKKHQHGEQPDEDTDSDLSSICSETDEDQQKGGKVAVAVDSTPHHRSRVPSPVNNFTPIQGNDSEHQAKRIKLPTFDQIKQDSSIRDPPPAGIACRPAKGNGNPRKRNRSPSISTPPPQTYASSSVTPSSSVAAPTSAPIPAPAPLPTQPPKKKNKTNKIKISPVKKTVTEPFVVTAGIGDLSDHRRVRYGSEEVSENEDVCAVCNGPGRFLCCERCPRSFHFTCLNPPLEEIPEGMWFCNKCTSQHNPPVKPPRGLFSELIDGINRRNPTSFRLPPDIRGYFVGVETGALGEYVDVRDNKTQKFSKSGFVEEYDTLKLKDKAGNAILCHHCGKSAVNGQRIISCDFCPLSWHLDCIGPMPMPNPPPTQKKWMCPAHADGLQPRRPKKAPIVDTSLRRGFKNNGVIEIENEEEVMFEDVMVSGIVYRLPERGIKLDFIEKVKTERPPIKETRKLKKSKATNATHLSTSPLLPLEDRPLIDQQLVQHLLEFSGNSAVLSTFNGGGINTLIEALISEATPSVKALFGEPHPLKNHTLSPATASLDTNANSNTTLSPERERSQLLALQEIITKRLQALQASSLLPLPPPPKSR